MCVCVRCMCASVCQVHACACVSGASMHMCVRCMCVHVYQAHACECVSGASKCMCVRCSPFFLCLENSWEGAGDSFSWLRERRLTGPNSGNGRPGSRWLHHVPGGERPQGLERPQRRACPVRCLWLGLESRSHLTPLAPAFLWGTTHPWPPLVLREAAGDRRVECGWSS